MRGRKYVFRGATTKETLGIIPFTVSELATRIFFIFDVYFFFFLDLNFSQTVFLERFKLVASVYIYIYIIRISRLSS